MIANQAMQVPTETDDDTPKYLVKKELPGDTETVLSWDGASIQLFGPEGAMEKPRPVVTDGESGL